MTFVKWISLTVIAFVFLTIVGWGALQALAWIGDLIQSTFHVSQLESLFILWGLILVLFLAGVISYTSLNPPSLSTADKENNNTSQKTEIYQQCSNCPPHEE